MKTQVSLLLLHLYVQDFSQSKATPIMGKPSDLSELNPDKPTETNPKAYLSNDFEFI